MIIPADAIIAEEKIRDYLLVSHAKNDKSEYLGFAGYRRANYQELIRDLREQLLPGEAIFQRQDRFGEYYAFRGHLRGPNGRRIGVETIWMHEHSGKIRFLTLYPD
jgi:hypothetical protein